MLLLQKRNDLKIIEENITANVILPGGVKTIKTSLIEAAAKAGKSEDLTKEIELVYADELATVDYQYYTLFKELKKERHNGNLGLKDYASFLWHCSN